MTTFKAALVGALLVIGPQASEAQQLPRPNETPRAVTLTLAEYNRLIDLASRPPQGPATPPVAAVLASADLRVRVDRDSARGVFTMQGDALRPGVSRVSMLAGATVTDANASGRPLPLVVDGSAHAALVPGPGPFSITLEWGAPLVFAPGRASFVLPVPKAGTAQATIDIPGEQADVHLSAGLVTRRTVTDGRTIVEVTLDPGSSTEVWWSMRDSAPVAAARDLRIVANVMTLITLGDADLRMAALIDVGVVQGELRTLSIQVPRGYELTAVSGSSIETSEPRDGELVLTLTDPALRSHQFLLTLERPFDSGSSTIETALVAVRDVQRERGEIAIEGVGTLELNAAERDGMHRIDVRELNAPLRALSRLPTLSAFRYQRSTATVPGLSLEVRRFADAGVLAAVADRAVATTLITSEGRALTEVALQVQNRAQPFLRVTLPAGATMVSVDVAGETAKPVAGADGIRVPLLRPGFRPTGRYEVSFVYLHAGTPFARKGQIQMTLPRMDIPVSIVQWEVFVPERYSVRAIDGNVIDVAKIERDARNNTNAFLNEPSDVRSTEEASPHRRAIIVVSIDPIQGTPGELRGHVRDTSGGVLPGVAVTLTAGGSQRMATTNGDGAFVFVGVAPGRISLDATLSGFDPVRAFFAYDGRSRSVEIPMRVGSIAETVAVAAEAPRGERLDREPPVLPPSENVINLQRRAAGVLPIRVDVPRAGTSQQLIKPLVVDQETVVTLRYKRR